MDVLPAAGEPDGPRTAPQYAILAVGSSTTETGIIVGQGAGTPKALQVGGPVGSNSRATVSIDASNLDVRGYTVDCKGGGYAGTITVTNPPTDLHCPGS